MLQRPNGFPYTKTLLISALAVSLAACSTGSESTTSPTPPASSPSPQATASSLSPQTTDVQSSVSIPGLKSVEEIQFKTGAAKLPNGFFDRVNNSYESSHQVTVTDSLKVDGWAFLPDEGRPADMVLITYGDNNSLVAVAPVTLQRQDVAKSWKNQAYEKSGWNATFNPSTLPGGEVVLKAWAYNSARKEATPLNRTHEVVINK